MPTPTYTPLANLTLGSSAASVTFSSISQAYRDLVLVATPISTINDGYLALQFNGSSSNYSMVNMEGNGTSTYSYTYSQIWVTLNNQNMWTTPSTFLINVMDYKQTDKHKTALLKGGTASQSLGASVGRWADTTAITSVTLQATSATFAAGSTFALYGIAA